VENAETPTKSKPKHMHSAPRDPDAIRTIVVSGLPPGIDSKSLWKKFRKQNGAQNVEWPVKLANEQEDTTTGGFCSCLRT
jgi:nucleolar protein 4